VKFERKYQSRENKKKKSKRGIAAVNKTPRKGRRKGQTVFSPESRERAGGEGKKKKKKKNGP